MKSSNFGLHPLNQQRPTAWTSTLLVEHDEKTHFPMADPDPIALIEHVMESRGLTRKDLEPMIGPRGRVADILNKTRPLTLEMIRRLVAQLDLPADVLVKSTLCAKSCWRLETRG